MAQASIIERQEGPELCLEVPLPIGNSSFFELDFDPLMRAFRTIGLKWICLVRDGEVDGPIVYRFVPTTGAHAIATLLEDLKLDREEIPWLHLRGFKGIDVYFETYGCQFVDRDTGLDTYRIKNLVLSGPQESYDDWKREPFTVTQPYIELKLYYDESTAADLTPAVQKRNLRALADRLKQALAPITK